MLELDEEVLRIWRRGHYKKLHRLLTAKLREQDRGVLDTLRHILRHEDRNGLVIKTATKTYFRLKRTATTDCQPLFELQQVELYNAAGNTVQAALMEVLGYDRMVPSPEDQRKILDLFFHAGEDVDLTGSSDPR
jgi:hypothetical protein